MTLIGVLLLSLFVRAEIADNTLDQMEHLSTDIKHRAAGLRIQFDASTKESIPMLDIESSMMEMENLVMQLESHISNLPPPSL